MDNVKGVQVYEGGNLCLLRLPGKQFWPYGREDADWFKFHMKIQSLLSQSNSSSSSMSVLIG